uniref:N-acetylmuramoyl-L-alanine amidase family protein n=1 Tax=uncultured Draconibacterium sp. TaxID=1573823 RepID=UPI00321783CB
MNSKIRIQITLTITFLLGSLWGGCLSVHPAEKDNTKISVVVIDPGHGGKDFGASVGNAREKDIVLDIALKLGNTIKKNYPDIKVVYTRSNDVFIPLYKRADIANKNDADLFISIHVNAVDAKYVQGTETFVLGLHRNDDNLKVAQKENAVILLEDDYNLTYEGFDPNLPESYIMFETMQAEFQEQSVMLASNIQNQFRDYSKRVDRSVKMAGFLVLRRTTMPSVLIETGFLSHSNERNYLLSESGKASLAQAIFKAFSTYKTNIEEKSKFNLVTNNLDESLPNESIKATQPTTAKKVLTETANITSENIDIKTKTEPDLYFSVQIMALKKKLDPTPENFKGEKTIFRIDATNISRYFSGKFDSQTEANAEKERISTKYKNAFVVAFKNGKLISVKNATNKR